MDDPQNLKIRKTANTLHWVTLVIVGLALISGLAIRAVEPTFVRVYFEKPLRRASGAVIDAFSGFFRDRRDGLTSFLPPADPDAMIAWAGEIERFFGQPVAVFVREGSHMTWVNTPEELEAAISLVPVIFRTDSANAAFGSYDTLGSFERRRSRVSAKGVDYTVWVVGPMADSLRWGAVARFDDSWRPFFGMLTEGAQAALLNRISQQLNEVLQVENTAEGSTSRTGMRAFLHDELAYQTPGLDTTHLALKDTVGSEIRLEYYLSDEDQAAMNYFSAQGLSWMKILFLILIGVVVHYFWRWIRTLT